MRAVRIAISAVFILSFVFLPGCSGRGQAGLHPGAEWAGAENRLLKGGIPADFFPVSVQIAALGDSLTKGTGDESGQGGYLPVLERKMEGLRGIRKVSAQNFAVNGLTSGGLLSMLKEERVVRAVKEADLICLSIGGNDLVAAAKESFRTFNLEIFESERKLFEERLNEILRRLKDVNPRAAILYIGLYNPFASRLPEMEALNGIVGDWNRAAERTASRYESVRFVDIAGIFRSGQRDFLAGDSFHPNREGYERIGEKAFAAFKAEFYGTPDEE